MSSKAASFLTLATCLSSPLAIGGCARQDSVTAGFDAVAELRSRLDSSKRPAFLDATDDRRGLWEAAQRFYERRGGEPAWLDDGGFRREAAELVAALDAAPLEGLDRADYDLGASAALVEQHSSRLRLKRERLDAADAIEAELRLSHAFLRYASHLLSGRVDPRELDANWVGQARHTELPDLLETALSERGVTSVLEDLRPAHPQYDLLKEALDRYQKISARDGWPTDLPADTTNLRQGDRGPGVVLLRDRLLADDAARGRSFVARLARVLGRSDVFDAALANELKRFEERHGLEPDGALDAHVVAALNVPVRQRVRQIELNLERWRWLPDELGSRYVIVNIPTFKLEAFEDDERMLEMRVATGTKEDPTPIFSERMTHIVFSPYWHVPPRIAREEWIPEAVHDPDYLSRNGLEVIKEGRVVDPRKVDWNDEDLRLRQRPGAENILGLVKFVFPNRFNVYLHDTPFESDFHRAARDKSHGCVRIEEPVELARWVLRGQKHWDRKRIEEAMHAGTEEQVEIEQPVPVYLIYQTAWVAENGSVRFSDDPYDYDAAQLALLERRATRGSLGLYDDASSTGTASTSGASGSLAPATGPTHRGVNPGLPRRTCAAARLRLSSKDNPRNRQDQNMARK